MPRAVLFGVGMIFGVKDAFRMSALRAFGVTVVSCFGFSLRGSDRGTLVFGSVRFAVSAGSAVPPVAWLFQRHHGQPSREGSFQAEP